MAERVIDVAAWDTLRRTVQRVGVTDLAERVGVRVVMTKGVVRVL